MKTGERWLPFLQRVERKDLLAVYRLAERVGFGRPAEDPTGFMAAVRRELGRRDQQQNRRHPRDRRWRPTAVHPELEDDHGDDEDAA